MFRLFSRAPRISPDADQNLFQAPTETRTRRDTVDKLVDADNAHMTPAKRVIFSLATGATGLAGMVNSNPINPSAQHDYQVMKVWGQQDAYESQSAAAPTPGSYGASATQNQQQVSEEDQQ
jgi:hypothetical protein